MEILSPGKLAREHVLSTLHNTINAIDLITILGSETSQTIGERHFSDSRREHVFSRTTVSAVLELWRKLR